MFCVTMAPNHQSIIKELALLLRLTREHVVLIKSIANLAGISLETELEEDLYKLGQRISNVEDSLVPGEATGKLAPYQHLLYYYHDFSLLEEGKMLLRETLGQIEDFCDILQRIKGTYGSEEVVWNALLEHLLLEERDMVTLLESLGRQLGSAHL